MRDKRKKRTGFGSHHVRKDARFSEDFGGYVRRSELKEIAAGHGAEVFSGVATAAFRNVDAAYAMTLIERIRRETQIEVTVISQDREARYGFAAAGARTGISKEQLVVWDIGGGSMQVSYWDADQDAAAGHLGDFASDAMRLFLMEIPQRSADDLTRAIQGAHDAALARIAPRVLQQLRSPGNEVVGIGGVHFFSNCEFLKVFSDDGCVFTRLDLVAQVLKFGHLTGQQIVDEGLSNSVEFAPSRVSNAALTVGFMQAFGIETVRAIRVDMTDAILLDPDFWTAATPIRF